MNRPLCAWLLVGVSLAGLLPSRGVAADNPLGGDDWKYDVVYRLKGAPYQGLVLKRGGGQLEMWCIVRNPGRPAIYYHVRLSDSEIDSVKLLHPAERETLRRRFTALQEEHNRLSEQLKTLDSAREPVSGVKITLRETPWDGDKRVTALRYDSNHFTLVSNAPRGVVMVTALHLEKVYAAYVRCLPPRAKGKPTTILLPQSLTDYQSLVRGQGRQLLNPAFFDPGKNQIVCAFDWQHMTEELERLHRYHDKLGATVDEREAELRKAYKGFIPIELRTLLADKRREIKSAEAHNRATFKRAQHHLLQRLFHEAFHAYLLNFVYPPHDGELPRWLNEGLAQIFETAVFEVGELRIGHADKERLDAVRVALSKDALLPLADLLRAGPKQFQVSHDGDKQISDRYYLSSWALAFYLTFDRKVLGTPALDAYVHNLNRGTDPLDAFRTLTGQPLSKFAQEFQDYLKHLRPDGRVGEGN
ncbi:MAG TPA: DUF1570 domain-containing protein [Gemmataceae bacterium]|jgi:hypothetical protein